MRPFLAVLVLCFAACSGPSGRFSGTAGPSTGGVGSATSSGGALSSSGGTGRSSSGTTGNGASGAETSSGGTAGGSAGGGTGGSSSGASTGTISGAFRVDNFGWRTGDPKVAVLLGGGGVALRLVDASTGAVAASYTASAAATDGDYSGDTYGTVDFSAFQTPGSYYLDAPSLGVRSYQFDIGDGVYDIVGAVAAKMYYFQRCNHDKALPYAGDALGSFTGLGGKWVDGACHAGDSSAAAGPGSVDDGTLDLHGGWHDAGDYQKTLWARGVPQLLFAYEMNPPAWTDGQLDIPESHNGVPDILDQAQWELDFYVRMMRPDGHFLTSVKGNDPTVTSPPSAANETRVYFDGTSPSGNGWSGGGVTSAEATGNAVLALAHGAIVFRAIGQKAIGDGYAAAATAGWAWLDGQTLTGKENELKMSAASAVYRMDPTQSSAQQFADAVAWDSFDGQFPGSTSPGEATLSLGAWHYLLNPAGSAAVKAKIQSGVQAGIVDAAFTADGPYGGMFGNSTNGWDWSWGSNFNQGMYGANLLMAAHFGILGSHAQAEVTTLAMKHLHFLLGLNPLNMVYLTNMAAYGGEHSSFQIFDGWFSWTGNDGDHGNASYNGKPASVTEPLYPYYVDDGESSTYGPAPGYVPGGPNWYYDASYTIPNRQWPAYAYRDFSVGCDWSGSVCKAASWELTEPDVNYQGAVVMLLSFAM
ncbi:MAG: glycoside hydrolase family 9 protein [Deltaproteobacteria bacterium]